MKQIISQFELQSGLFKNATKDFNDAQAEQTSGEANHAKWLTGHVVSTRYMMANLLGLNLQEPFPALFADGKGRQADASYPSMPELVKDWDVISQKVTGRLNEMSEDDFNAPAPFPTPMGDGTMKGLIGFFSHHEAYTIGQIAYNRRISGLEAMKYN